MNTEAIESRLKKIEKQLRMWKLAAFGFLLLTVTVGAGPATRQTINARMVTLSEGGKANMVLQPDGILLYQAEKLRATIRSESDSGAIKLYDQAGKPVMIVEVNNDRPEAYVIDSKIGGKERIFP